MEKKIIAVFGGSFNPPTVAHIGLAKQILKKIVNVEKVIFVPVSTKYNKSGLASDEERYNMLKTICDNEAGLEVSKIEIDSTRQLYTIETLEQIKNQNQDSDICFVLGTDNLKELETWYNACDLLEKFKFIVLERDKDCMEAIIANNNFLQKHKKSFIKLTEIEKIELSASYVREQIKLNRSILGMVPQEIEQKAIEIYK